MTERFQEMSLDELLLVEVSSLTVKECKAMSSRISALYEQLDAEEPEDEESEEYADWLESLEDLDDLMDELEDHMEE